MKHSSSHIIPLDTWDMPCHTRKLEKLLGLLFRSDVIPLLEMAGGKGKGKGKAEEKVNG